MLWECKYRHKWSAPAESILSGRWCKDCSVGFMERVCRQYFEQIFKLPFPNTRPNWLINPTTGKKLELDGYAEKLSLAFEYHGQHHYRYNKLFHKNLTDLKKRKALDIVKVKLARSNGVSVIEIPQIPTDLKLENLMEHLVTQFKLKNISYPKNIFLLKIDLKKAYAPEDSKYLNLMKDICRFKEGQLLSPAYLGLHTKLEFKCKENHHWMASPSKIVLSKRWCPTCAKAKRKNAPDKISLELKRYSVEFISGNYEHLNSKLKFRCLKCEYIFNESLNTLRSRTKKGYACVSCSGNRRKLHPNDLMPFHEAREFVHKLKLKSQKEWDQYTNGKRTDLPSLPFNIPASPRNPYKNKGWISSGDWLGTDRIANQKIRYRSFSKARLFARSLGLKNQKEWIDYSNGKIKKRKPFPSDIPKYPNDSIYRSKGWKSWADWLNTKNTKGEYAEFESARAYVRKLKLKSSLEWKDYIQGKNKKLGKKPDWIPKAPRSVYKNHGWRSMEDWLGYEEKTYKDWLPFEKAKIFVHKLKLKNWKEWNSFALGKHKHKRPNNIPTAPNIIYKQQWKDWQDWIGESFKGRVKFWDFIRARNYVQSLNIHSRDEWNKFLKSDNKPLYIPANPYFVYKNSGWISFGDWLGTNRVANQNRVFLSFYKAREFARKLKIKSQIEWNKYCKNELSQLARKPNYIPSDPAKTYKKSNEWRGWKDWLGTK